MTGTQTYRFAICERFARLAHEKKVRWVVLHGSEEYPHNIGRDIDCLTATVEDTRAALACFQEAATANPDTKWITYPHPIWGHRCVAISSDYQVAELHILHYLSSGLIGHCVNFDNADMDMLFPQERAAFIMKAVVLPILGNSPKVHKTIEGLCLQDLPLCVQHAYQDLQTRKKVTLLNRIKLYLHFGKNPIRAAYSLYRSCFIKLYHYFARTVPVFYFDKHFDETKIAAIVDRLSEVFIHAQDVSQLSSAATRSLQARQLFLYERSAGHTPDAVTVPHVQEDEAADFIISTFCALHTHPWL